MFARFPARPVRGVALLRGMSRLPRARNRAGMLLPGLPTDYPACPAPVLRSSVCRMGYSCRLGRNERPASGVSANRQIQTSPRLRGRAAVSIQTIAHHFLAKVLECAMAAALEGCRIGEAAMVTRILKDFVLFSCLAAFPTGIVLAAATLLI